MLMDGVVEGKAFVWDARARMAELGEGRLGLGLWVLDGFQRGGGVARNKGGGVECLEGFNFAGGMLRMEICRQLIKKSYYEFADYQCKRERYTHLMHLGIVFFSSLQHVLKFPTRCV